VVARDSVVQQCQFKSGESFTQFQPVFVTISCESQEEFPIMTTVCQMVNLTRNKVSIGPWHEPMIVEQVTASMRNKNGGKKRVQALS